jgi:outer membrane protein W
MKTLSKSKRAQSFFLATMLVAGAGMTVAQADTNKSLLNDTDSILNSEQIDIDGQFRKKNIDAKQLAKLRKKIEKRHEEMIQQKIEDIRLQEELKLGQKLQAAFSDNGNSDAVSMGQAAVAKQTMTGAAPTLMGAKKNRVIPSLGLLKVQSDNTNFDTLNANIGFETTIKERFIVGLSVGYANLDIKDINPNYAYSSFSSFNNGFYNPYAASSAYNTGREMSYKQLDIAVNGKFYVLKNSKVKPFVGLGAGFRRSTLQYNTADPFFNQAIGLGVGQTLEEAEYVGNYVTGEASVGADMNISSNIGARLSVNYSRGLTESSQNANSTDANNVFYQSADQNNLDNVGREIEKASMLGISAGLIVNF